VNSQNIHLRPGFTLVELCIGMVITAFIMAALAAFSLATATAWDNGITTNVNGGKTISSISMMGTLAAARLQNEIGPAQCIGGYFAGALTNSTGQQSSVLIWTSDSNIDGYVNANEAELLEYDATAHTIYKYTSTSVAQVDYTVFGTSNYIATFKSIASKTPLARNIDGMQIYVQTPTSLHQFPLVEYELYFNRGGYQQTRYGAVCVRSPCTAHGMVLN
jgi:Tfp pilus assembly protein FimT